MPHSCFMGSLINVWGFRQMGLGGKSKCFQDTPLGWICLKTTTNIDIRMPDCTFNQGKETIVYFFGITIN